MKNYNRILVTQTGGWIGDMVLLTPALRALRHHYKNSYIAMLIRPLARELMMDNPYLDELMIYDKRGKNKGIPQLWELARRLRRLQFDLAVVLHPNSIRSALIPYLARIPHRIGTKVSGRGIFLTHSINDRDDIHEVHRYLRPLRLIGIDDADPKLEFWHTMDDRLAVKRILSAHGISTSDIIAGVNVGTTWESKRWKIERFAEIIDTLSRRYKFCVVLTGSPAEKPLGDKLKELTSTSFINLIGRTNLRQLGALIEQMEFYITCDSGPMHIAAAVNTPTVALFGPTSPIRHAPYGNGHIVIQKQVECSPCYERICSRNHECMEAIEVEEVIGYIQDSC